MAIEASLLGLLVRSSPWPREWVIVERWWGGVPVTVTVRAADVRVEWRSEEGGGKLLMEEWPLFPGECEALRGNPEMASRFIKAAISKAPASEHTAGAGDPVLFKARPALEEFMTLAVDDEGRPREVSALMAAMTAEEVRVGLKDEAAGGWCWRTGKTFVAALDALEKALQSGEPVFRQTGGQGRWKGKK